MIVCSKDKLKFQEYVIKDSAQSAERVCRCKLQTGDDKWYVYSHAFTSEELDALQANGALLFANEESYLDWVSDCVSLRGMPMVRYFETNEHTNDVYQSLLHKEVEDTVQESEIAVEPYVQSAKDALDLQCNEQNAVTDSLDQVSKMAEESSLLVLAVSNRLEKVRDFGLETRKLLIDTGNMHDENMKLLTQEIEGISKAIAKLDSEIKEIAERCNHHLLLIQSLRQSFKKYKVNPLDYYFKLWLKKIKIFF